VRPLLCAGDSPMSKTIQNLGVLLLLTLLQADRPNRWQPQRVELGMKTATDANGTSRVTVTALYGVCETVDGTRRLLRQGIPLAVTVGKSTGEERM
jgi:hypothetical protein